MNIPMMSIIVDEPMLENAVVKSIIPAKTIASAASIDVMYSGISSVQYSTTAASRMINPIVL